MQAGGQRFESVILHQVVKVQCESTHKFTRGFIDILEQEKRIDFSKNNKSKYNSSEKKNTRKNKRRKLKVYALPAAEQSAAGREAKEEKGT